MRVFREQQALKNFKTFNVSARRSKSGSWKKKTRRRQQLLKLEAEPSKMSSRAELQLQSATGGVGVGGEGGKEEHRKKCAPALPIFVGKKLSNMQHATKNEANKQASIIKLQEKQDHDDDDDDQVISKIRATLESIHNRVRVVKLRQNETNSKLGFSLRGGKFTQERDNIISHSLCLSIFDSHHLSSKTSERKTLAFKFRARKIASFWAQ